MKIKTGRRLVLESDLNGRLKITCYERRAPVGHAFRDLNGAKREVEQLRRRGWRLNDDEDTKRTADDLERLTTAG